MRKDVKASLQQIPEWIETIRRCQKQAGISRCWLWTASPRANTSTKITITTKNGINKSVMVVYDIYSNVNPHVYAGARGKMSLNKVDYETLAWMQNCYSPSGGYITAGNAEANCQELLKAHLKICRKYKNMKQAETKPVKRKTFNK